MRQCVLGESLSSSVRFNPPQLSVYIDPADPGFYMVNWLWIGKCHLALGKREEAEPWLERTVSYETILEEELEVHIYSAL